jgi:hypothetical protein
VLDYLHLRECAQTLARSEVNISNTGARAVFRAGDNRCGGLLPPTSRGAVCCSCAAPRKHVINQRKLIA